jgi:predicted transcriptional regulator
MKRPEKLPALPPVWLVKSLNLFRNALLTLNRRMFPGNVVLYEQFQYFWMLPSLYIAAKLDVAGFLQNCPETVENIAKHTGTNVDALRRILRALASQGIFKETKDGRFRMTRMSEGLLDKPGSLRYAILHHLGPVNWNLMSNLMYAVKSGDDPFTNKYGVPIYEYLQNHPEEFAVFDKSMSNLSDLGLAPILNGYDFSRFKTIVDLGGGEGFLLARIMNQCPASKGVLFDLPEAVVKAPAMLASNNALAQVEIVTGNLFSEIPAEGDLYILKNVVHNWSDDAFIRMFKNLRTYIKSGARILIIEMIVAKFNSPSLPLLLDIQMLACMQGGRERSRAEFEHICNLAGFRVSRVVETIAPLSLIEVQPLDAAKHE